MWGTRFWIETNFCSKLLNDFWKRFRVTVHVLHEVPQIDRSRKCVHIQNRVCVVRDAKLRVPLQISENGESLSRIRSSGRRRKKLSHETAQPLACQQCHGAQGDGRGPLGGGLVPLPRNFTCSQTMNDLSDGQLFWIIKQGLPGTGMMAFAGLPAEQVWQLIQYIEPWLKPKGCCEKF